MRKRSAKTKPLYLAIEDHVLDLVASPDYGPGDKIPSERQLADDLGANRMTVRKAIDRLVDRGVLERNGTSGTRVPAPSVARPIDLSEARGITRIISAGGGKPGNTLLHFGEAVASERIAQRTGLKPGAPLVMFRRLWSANGAPFCIETTWLPADRFAAVHAEDLVAGQSLYALLSERFGVTKIATEREISVGAAADLEARHLGLKTGAPTLVLRLVARDAAGRPVEYTKSVNNPQQVVFRTPSGKETA